jgi:hypothetical protein
MKSNIILILTLCKLSYFNKIKPNLSKTSKFCVNLNVS